MPREGRPRAKNPGRRGARAARSAPAARPEKPPRRADPRRIAYDVLAAVHERAAYANLLLPRLLTERGLAGRDAALATELTYGTLRGQGSYDAVLAACSDRPLEKLDPPVLLVLRLGTHQLLSTRVGAHAAVATSVDLAKSVAGPRVSGYVNAVLRRVATRNLDAWLAIVAPATATDPDGHLAIRYSHPRWVVDAYRAALGDAADAPFTASFTGAPRDGGRITGDDAGAPGAFPGQQDGQSPGDPALSAPPPPPRPPRPPRPPGPSPPSLPSLPSLPQRSASSRPHWPRAIPAPGSPSRRFPRARTATRSCRRAPSQAAGPGTRSRWPPEIRHR